MIIPGYLDGYEPPFAHSPLADGSELMAGDLFWPTFLAMVGASSSAPDAFGADPADLEEIAEALLDERRWPVFTLPAAGASRVHVVMRNFPGEGGVASAPACLHGPGSSRRRRRGRDGGAHRGGCGFRRPPCRAVICV